MDRLVPQMLAALARINHIEIDQNERFFRVKFLDGFNEKALNVFVDFLSHTQCGFSYYDGYYPSMSERGAYVTSTPFEFEGQQYFHIFLGNHGWTGTYEISQVVQKEVLCHLFRNGYLKDIRLEGVSQKTLRSNLRKEDIVVFDHWFHILHTEDENIQIADIQVCYYSYHLKKEYTVFRFQNGILYSDSKSKFARNPSYPFHGIISKDDTIFQLLKTMPVSILKKVRSRFYTAQAKSPQIIFRIEADGYFYNFSFPAKYIPYGVLNESENEWLVQLHQALLDHKSGEAPK